MAKSVAASDNDTHKRVSRKRTRTVPTSVVEHGLDRTLSDLYLLWLDEVQHKTPATLRSYTSVIEQARMWMPLLLDGPQRWEDVKPHHIEAFMNRTRRSGQQPLPATRSHDRVVLNELFKYMVNRGYMQTNPAQLVSPVRQAHVDQESKAVDDPVFRKVWTARLSTDDRLWIGLAAISGLRVSEIASISPTQVDTTRGMLMGLRRKGGTKMGVPYKQLGTLMEAKLPLVYPRAGEWVEIVEKYARDRQGMRCLITYDNPTTEKERRASSFTDEALPSPKVLGRTLDWIITDVGVTPEERFTPHALRHTACTNMLRCDLPLTLVSQVMGHANLQTTMLYDRTERRLAEWMDNNL